VNKKQLTINLKEKSMTDKEIENIFTYHKPFGDQPTRYENLRSVAKELATLVEKSCPNSREKSLAITNLQQSIMWANASIAINEKEN
jgi:hypothetical protein